MKKTLLLAAAAAGVLSLCIFGLPGKAQGPAAARQPGGQGANGFAGKVVLLDVNYVFKNHARFKAMMNQLKNDADAMDAQMKKDEAQLRSMAMGLQKLNAGSAEYKKLEEDIARSKTDWTIKVQQQRREFLMREAKTYNDTYKEIEDEVNYFCQSNGILMVLRFMGDPVEEGNPDSILANINKPVVWYDKNLDITPYIMQRFAAPAGTADRRNSPTGGGAVPPGYTAPRGSVPPSPFNGSGK
ncbi:MAG: OmpH family outer membrane protein [Pirellulales bacterium]|nr:OmpH family outer membrane protein [Pirellulales bacterium]